MKIGVLALQGAFIEHIHVLEKLGIEGVEIRLPEQLEGMEGLIIPGGESTTIGKLAVDYGLVEPLKEFARSRPVWGTCAGMIFLAKDIGRDQPLLGLMDIKVNRNAFGRQVDSFEADLDIKGLDTPFHAIFIRAPLVTDVDETKNVEVLGQLEEGGGIVAVRQGHLLATAFHPELTDDSRIHELFVKMVKSIRQVAQP